MGASPDKLGCVVYRPDNHFLPDGDSLEITTWYTKVETTGLNLLIMKSCDKNVETTCKCYVINIIMMHWKIIWLPLPNTFFCLPLGASHWWDTTFLKARPFINVSVIIAYIPSFFCCL